jgi:pyrroline-5-carboxylate reductase
MFLAKKTLAILGAGRIGESLISGLVEAEAIRPVDIVGTARHRERLAQLEDRLGIRTSLDNREAVRGASIVVIAVKPQVVKEVLAEVRSELTRDHLVVSVAASVSTAAIERELESPVPVVRAMPNTPCLVKAGMTAIAPGRHATDEHVHLVRRMFEAVGRCVIVDERYMDAVTGLSASGPAFIYIIIESLAEAGVKVGLPRHIATELAAQTVLGSAHMVLETGEHPAQLKDQVTTPAGCTIDGILELEDGGLRVTLIKAVVRATRRASELVHG